MQWFFNDKAQSQKLCEVLSQLRFWIRPSLFPLIWGRNFKKLQSQWLSFLESVINFNYFNRRNAVALIGVAQNLHD